MQLSRRVQSLRPAATVAVSNRAKELCRKGVPVLSFGAGEPDFDTPPRIKQAAIDALNAGLTKYAPAAGDPETRAVIAEKLTRENGIPDCTAQHVVIAGGGKHALYLLFQALLDPPAPGEKPWEVLLPVPAWVSYDPMARLAGGEVVELGTTPQNDFKITPQQLEAAITPRSRVLLLNSPSNPCGTMYTPDEIRALAAVVERAAKTVAPDLVVISDEIYEKIIYGGIEHLSLGSIPGIAARTITMNGMGKAYAMTGWRVGYLAGSGEFGLQVAKATEKLIGQMTTSIAQFVFPAVRTAITQCADDVEQMRRAFARRAELIYSLSKEIPGWVCPRPTGAFYLFPDISAYLGKTSPGGRPLKAALDVGEALLEECQIAVVPGEDFGGCGHRHIRLSFACSDEQIREGMKRMAEFFAKVR